MTERGIGDNGGPPLKKFTASQKLERIRHVLETDMTATQKCIGIGLIAEADTDGLAEGIGTRKLQLFGSASDRETVYRATKVLEQQNVAKPIKVKGKPNNYQIIPAKTMDAIVEAYNELKTSRVEPDMGSPAKADRISVAADENAVGFNPTSPVEPVGFDPTGKERFPHTPSKENKQITLGKQTTTTTSTVESDAEGGGGGLNFDCLNGTAVDLTAFIAKHNLVDPITARNMLANNVRTFGAQCMMEAFSSVIAQMPGGCIARPYPYLIETARKIRDSHNRQQKSASDPKESTHEKIRRFAEKTEAEERLKRERRT